MRVGAIATIALMAVCHSPVSLAGDMLSSSCAATRVSEGCGTYTWPDGTRYIGGFHGGFFNGPGVVVFPDGSRLELTYRGGVVALDAAKYTEADGKTVSGALQDVTRDLTHPHTPVDYPFWRALFGDQADVIVAAIVDKDGTISTAQVYGNIDSDSYAEAALKGVKKWRYMPATIGGKPVPIPYMIDLQFSQPR